MTVSPQGAGRVVVPKAEAQTPGVTFYVELVTRGFSSFRSEEVSAPVASGSECRRQDPDTAYYTGPDPNISVGATHVGPQLPPGFQADGITRFISSTGLPEQAAGGGISGKTVGLIAGGGGGAAALALIGGSKNSNPGPPVGGNTTVTTTSSSTTTAIGGGSSSTTTTVGGGGGSTTTTTVGGGGTTTTIPGSSTTTVIGGGSTTTVIGGSTTTVVGGTTTAGSTTTVVGSTTTVVGSTTTVVGSTTTVAGSTTTVVGSTTTVAGSTTTTASTTVSTSTTTRASTTTTAGSTTTTAGSTTTTAASTTVPSSTTTKASTTTTSAGAAQLSISKSGPGNVNPNTAFTYTVRVTNVGTATANFVEILDQLPATFLSLNPVAGCGLTGVNEIHCFNITIGAGKSVTLSIGVKSPSSSGTLSNTAQAWWGNPLQGPVSATARTAINLRADDTSGERIAVRTFLDVEPYDGRVHGRLVLNDSEAVDVSNSGTVEQMFRAVAGENRVEASLVGGTAGRGFWRFNFSGARGFVPGSILVDSGAVYSLDANSIAFTVSGNGPLRFRFRVSDSAN